MEPAFPDTAHRARSAPADKRKGIGDRGANDEAQFEAMFRDFYAGLCRFVAEYVQDPKVAEDLVQEVFLALWERRHSWEPRTSVKAYLFKAVRNRALDYLDTARVRRRHGEHLSWDLAAGSQLSPDRILEGRERAKAVREAIDELPPRRRHVFELSRRQGLTYAEIAEVLDISERTVETHIGRALKFLRERLGVRR